MLSGVGGQGIGDWGIRGQGSGVGSRGSNALVELLGGVFLPIPFWPMMQTIVLTVALPLLAGILLRRILRLTVRDESNIFGSCLRRSTFRRVCSERLIPTRKHSV